MNWLAIKWVEFVPLLVRFLTSFGKRHAEKRLVDWELVPFRFHVDWYVPAHKAQKRKARASSTRKRFSSKSVSPKR